MTTYTLFLAAYPSKTYSAGWLAGSITAERFMTLKMGQATMPTEAFQAVLNVAERVLSPEDWASLKAMLK
jgi:hypothetical protein